MTAESVIARDISIVMEKVAVGREAEPVGVTVLDKGAPGVTELVWSSSGVLTGPRYAMTPGPMI
jgi:hypothetical protein